MTRTKSRMLKIQCSGCGAILYGSTTSLRASKGLVCGCGDTFDVSHTADLLAVDPDRFWAAAAELGPTAYNQMMREAGLPVERSAGTIASMKRAEAHRRARTKKRPDIIPF